MNHPRQTVAAKVLQETKSSQDPILAKLAGMPMRASRFQNTLRRPCQVSGRGYWTGQVNQLTFLPADVDSGIRFLRTDLPGSPSVLASEEFRVEMPLRTRLQDGDAVVDMVEHVMAALYGLRIDNCVVQCTAAEMPGMDGSCLAFALALLQAETVRQPKPRWQRVIDRPIRIGDSQKWIAAYPAERPGLQIEYRLDYGADHEIPSGTFACRLTPESFAEQLAPARTFISQSDAVALQRQGMAKHVTNRDLLIFDHSGPIDNSLRFPDECARHKALDLVGDLALCGLDLSGRIIAYRSGHVMNGRMASELRKQTNVLAATDGSVNTRAA